MEVPRIGILSVEDAAVCRGAVAFARIRSTLEETKYADLILHVVDSSSDEIEMQMQVVDKILSELEITDINKIYLENGDPRVAYEKVLLTNSGK